MLVESRGNVLSPAVCPSVVPSAWQSTKVMLLLVLPDSVFQLRLALLPRPCQRAIFVPANLPEVARPEAGSSEARHSFLVSVNHWLEDMLGGLALNDQKIRPPMLEQLLGLPLFAPATPVRVSRSPVQ